MVLFCSLDHVLVLTLEKVCDVCYARRGRGCSLALICQIVQFTHFEMSSYPKIKFNKRRIGHARC